jgi:galactose-1-phosphate uridylyltransferase
MNRETHLLVKNDLPGEIEIHSDLLSTMPSALSRKRALKVRKLKQEEMKDVKEGQSGCLLCHPEKRPAGASEFVEDVPGKVGSFANDFPYWPEDQRVIFLWSKEEDLKRKVLHRARLRDVSRFELYWLMKACVDRGNGFYQPDHTYDLMRMVAGFNLGKLAGQSQPHIHLQYGWEVVLNRRSISEEELGLYFEELRMSDLILFDNSDASGSRPGGVRVVAPWTPKGQYAVDLYFANKYEITDMKDPDLRIFSIVGEALIKKYRQLGIENLNIVFSNSPYKRKIEPLVVHFVPRASMTALYEIRGVNVVDTPPQKIAEEFRRVDGSAPNWSALIDTAERFNPSEEWDQMVKERTFEFDRKVIEKMGKKARGGRTARNGKRAIVVGEQIGRARD